MTIEAMKQALEALELYQSKSSVQMFDDAVKALRAAIEQAEKQEPFCYHDGRNIVGKEYADHSDVFPLYTAPRQWQGLTDDDLSVCDDDGVILARYWEAKLKEKNG